LVHSVFFLYVGPEVPSGNLVQAIHGFVEELDVKDDPEYQVGTDFNRGLNDMLGWNTSEWN